MSTVVTARPSAVRRASFLSRLLDRCVQLLPYLALPGYYPASHAYHFRADRQASPPAARGKKAIRLPSTAFHR